VKIVECQQYTPEWYEARRGIPTASSFDRIITPTGKYSAGARGYICELIADTVNQSPNFFSETGRRPMNHAMQVGADTEPEARRWYAFERDVQVKQVGFVLSDCGRYGCSPDGLVGDDGLLELKCPAGKAQVEYLLAGGLPADYRPQVHGQLLVTGRKWVDFVSYADYLPTLIVRVVPDEYTDKLRAALDQFLKDYDAAKLAVLKGAAA
jgi:hypothetical protein